MPPINSITQSPVLPLLLSDSFLGLLVDGQREQDLGWVKQLTNVKIEFLPLRG